MTNWKDTLETLKIPKKYHNDCIILCSRVLEKEDDPYKTELVTMTLRVLSKIDLSKIEFTDNKKYCENYRVSMAIKPGEINDLKHFGIDVYSQICSTLSNEIIQHIEKKIKETGGMIIYSVIDNYYEDIDPSFNYNTIVINGKMIDFKTARFAKILKLKQKIYDKQIT
jgi:hypothetical protein